MKRTLLVAILLTLGLVLQSSAGMMAPPSPASVIWDVTPFTGNVDAAVTVTVSDIGNQQIEIKMENTGIAGDLTGLFFNVDGGINGILGSMFSVDTSKSSTGASLSKVCLSSTGITSCDAQGNDNNLNGGSPNFPAGSFNVGFEIGTNGNDNLSIVTFIFDYAGISPARTFSENSFAPFAARVKSINANPDSSKLFSGPDPKPDTETQIPEPSTLLMLGAGLGLVSLAKIRRRS